MRPDTGRMGVEETYKGVGNVSTVRASRPVVTAWAPEDATSPRGVERRVETCFFEADGLTGLDPCARGEWFVAYIGGYRNLYPGLNCLI